MLKIALIAAYVISTSLGLITLKLSTHGGLPIAFHEGILALNINTYTLIGVFLYGFSFLLYMYLLSKFNLGYIIPLTTALVYTVIFIASFIIFHEIFTMLKLLGIGFILSGLTLLNLKGGYEKPLPE
jgi:drug/metabolite transporter (DMT)-like permease